MEFVFSISLFFLSARTQTRKSRTYAKLCAWRQRGWHAYEPATRYQERNETNSPEIDMTVSSSVDGSPARCHYCFSPFHFLIPRAPLHPFIGGTTVDPQDLPRAIQGSTRAALGNLPAVHSDYRSRNLIKFDTISTHTTTASTHLLRCHRFQSRSFFFCFPLVFSSACLPLHFISRRPTVRSLYALRAFFSSRHFHKFRLQTSSVPASVQHCQHTTDNSATRLSRL